MSTRIGATRGNWNEVWDAFDNRKQANVAGVVAGGDGGEGSMFSRAGVAAE